MVIQYTKWWLSTPNDDSVHQMVIQYTKWWFSTPNGDSVHQMVIQYTKWWFSTPYGDSVHQMVIQYTKWWFSTPNGDSVRCQASVSWMYGPFFKLTRCLMIHLVAIWSIKVLANVIWAGSDLTIGS